MGYAAMDQAETSPKLDLPKPLSSKTRMTQSSAASMHGIRDNHSRGSVAEFLTLRMSEGSAVSVVSAYFTIHAYQALKANLDGIDRLKFLFGEPRFIASLGPVVN